MRSIFLIGAGRSSSYLIKYLLDHSKEQQWTLTVGDISLESQSKLLRVLQEQEFERLGSTRTLRTDVRLVAATNRNLVQLTAEKQFREDLYFRLNVFPIRIPPLRERGGDIPLLVRHYVAHEL